MATLQLAFNCMCLFVTDPKDGVVHVLMPATHHHGSHDEPAPAPGHDGHDHPVPQPKPSVHGKQAHVVRMLHASFNGKKGRSMEGWALELQGTSTPAEPAPDNEANGGPEIVHLSRLTGGRVPRKMVEENPFPDHVAARVTLRGGKLTKVVDEGTRWILGGRRVVMAHQAVWQIEDVDALTWIDLGASQGPPIRALSELGPEPAGGYRLDLHHVTEKALPPNALGVLSEKEVRDHFASYYELLDGANEEPLPELENRGAEGGKFNCKTAWAELEWTV